MYTPNICTNSFETRKTASLVDVDVNLASYPTGNDYSLNFVRVLSRKHRWSQWDWVMIFIYLFIFLQSTQYPSKNHQGGHSDRYGRRDSPSFRNRDDSPSSRRSPRYANKASYIERSREKLQQGKHILTVRPFVSEVFNTVMVFNILCWFVRASLAECG